MLGSQNIAVGIRALPAPPPVVPCLLPCLHAPATEAGELGPPGVRGEPGMARPEGG